MKNMHILAVLLLIATWFSAAGQNVKEKKITGRFPADKGKLVIDNRYGKLDINTWDKNEVTVDITITAKAKSAGKAQEILDKISISEPQANSSGIHYKTIIEKGKTSGNNTEFSINYVVNMPRKHTSELTNKFGDIELADVDGKLNIDLEYGGLKTGAIRGGDKDIKVGFGSANISSIETGNIKSSYSKLTIGTAGSIEVSNQFEKTNIGTVRNLDIAQKYGDLKIGSVSQLKGTMQYAGLFVDKLLKSVEMTLKYSNAKFDYVGPDADNINITSSFGNLSFHFDNAASLSGDVAASFGNVTDHAGNISLTKSGANTPGTTANHKVKIGGGRGSMDITVSYGNVDFR